MMWCSKGFREFEKSAKKDKQLTLWSKCEVRGEMGELVIQYTVCRKEVLFLLPLVKKRNCELQNLLCRQVASRMPSKCHILFLGIKKRQPTAFCKDHLWWWTHGEFVYMSMKLWTLGCVVWTKPRLQLQWNTTSAFEELKVFWGKLMLTRKASW